MCQRRVSFSLHRHVSRLVLQGIVIHALRADCARLDPSIRLARAPDILSNLIKLPRVSGFPWFLGEKGEASMKVGVVKFAKLRELNLRFSRRTSGAKFGRESETVSFDAGKREILTLEEGGGMIGFNNPLADVDGVR